MFQKTCWFGTDENVEYTLALNFKIPKVFLNKKVTISVREGCKAEKLKNSGRRGEMWSRRKESKIIDMETKLKGPQ